MSAKVRQLIPRPAFDSRRPISASLDVALTRGRRFQWPADFLHRDTIIECQAQLQRVWYVLPADRREGFARALQYLSGLLSDQARLWEAVLALRTIEKVLESEAA